LNILRVHCEVWGFHVSFVQDQVWDVAQHGWVVFVDDSKKCNAFSFSGSFVEEEFQTQETGGDT
jgi:hypothetical protein